MSLTRRYTSRCASSKMSSLVTANSTGSDSSHADDDLIEERRDVVGMESRVPLQTARRAIAHDSAAAATWVNSLPTIAGAGGWAVTTVALRHPSATVVIARCRDARITHLPSRSCPCSDCGGGRGLAHRQDRTRRRSHACSATLPMKRSPSPRRDHGCP